MEQSQTVLAFLGVSVTCTTCEPHPNDEALDHVRSPVYSPPQGLQLPLPLPLSNHQQQTSTKHKDISVHAQSTSISSWVYIIAQKTEASL